MRSRPRVRLGTREADEALSSWHANVYEEPDDDDEDQQEMADAMALSEELDDDR